MIKLVMLVEELGPQMRLYLALSDNYNILFAENIEATMYYLRRAKPALLLLDYNLAPFKTDRRRATQFIAKIKAKYQDLKIATVLNSGNRHVEKEIQRSGTDEIIYVPIEPEQLLVKMRRLTEDSILNADEKEEIMEKKTGPVEIEEFLPA